MKEFLLTYWWFGLAGNLPSGLTVRPPPGLSGGRTGVATVAALDVDRAIAQFPTLVGSAPGRADFLVLSAIRLPDLQVAARGVFVDGADTSVSMVDDVDSDLDAAERYVGMPGANEYVVTGTITGDDQRYVQRVSDDRVEGAVAKVLRWLYQRHEADDIIAEVWSVVERSGHRVRVYRGTDRKRGPGQVETNGASWRRREFEQVLMGQALPASAHPPGLLEKVNRDRARRRQRALAPGEWSTADLEEFARYLPNPAIQEIKERLLR